MGLNTIFPMRIFRQLYAWEQDFGGNTNEQGKILLTFAYMDIAYALGFEYPTYFNNLL